MSFSEQLKGQLNIVDVVGQYVRLKRQGAGPRYAGLCPFHSEKTPSFSVHGALQIYKCFGCDASGDVFQFVMEREGLTFPETLRTLADRYGIPFPERERSSDPETQARAAIQEMHEIAAELFQSNLRGSGGGAARAYLESRGVTRQSADEFRLGLSDTSGQQLTSRLQRFGPRLLEGSGLVIKRQDRDGFFDRFRGRLMFPIHNESGKVIAFGGRALRPDEEPKYLNSPETKLYKKSAVLFNLHRAKSDARKNDRMVVVEGYMDVIGVYAAGVREVVATSGTALAVEQVRSIKRQIALQQASTGQVLLNFDPDSAGIRSTEKYIGALLAEGLRVRVIAIPGGLDPDEYIQANGADAYRSLLDSAPSFFHWLVDRARERFDLHTPEGRVDAFKFLIPSVQHVNDRVERAAILTEIAAQFGLDRELVRDALGRGAKGAPSEKQTDFLSSVPPMEKLLLSCLILNEEARAAILTYLSQSETLHLLELNSIFAAAVSDNQTGLSFSTERLSQRLDPRMQRILAEITFNDCGITTETAVQQALNCLEALETRALRHRLDQTKRRIKELERQGDMTQAFKLMVELESLERRSTQL